MLVKNHSRCCAVRHEVYYQPGGHFSHNNEPKKVKKNDGDDEQKGETKNTATKTPSDHKEKTYVFPHIFNTPKRREKSLQTTQSNRRYSVLAQATS